MATWRRVKVSQAQVVTAAVLLQLRAIGEPWLLVVRRWCGASSSRPVALFVMNARQPATGAPALMSLDEARTLFHEFGHAMQQGLLAAPKPAHAQHPTTAKGAVLE